MRVLELEIQNFGPHEHIHVTELDNIVGVLGRNGTGKSHIITAIGALLLGDLDGQSSSWVKASPNKDGTLPKFALLRGKFEINGQICFIERKISAGKTGNTRSLRINDGSPITKAKDVDKAIEDVIGVDRYTIANTLFAVQGEISNILDCSDSERIKLFTKWFNLGFLAKQHDWLHAKIQELEKSVVSIGPLKDNLAADIAKYDEMKTMIEATQIDLDSKYVSEQLSSEFTRKYSQYKTYIDARQEANQTLKVLQETESTILQKYQSTTLDDLKSKYESLLSLHKTSNDLLTSVKNAEKQFSDLGICSPSLYVLYRFYTGPLVVNKSEDMTIGQLIELASLYCSLRHEFGEYIAKLDVGMCDLSLEQEKLTQVQELITSTNSEIATHTSTLSTLFYKRGQLSEQLVKLDSLKSELTTKGEVCCPYCLSKITDVSHLDNEVNNILSELTLVKNQIETTDNQLQELNKKLHDYNVEHNNQNGVVSRLRRLGECGCGLLNKHITNINAYGLSKLIWNEDVLQPIADNPVLGLDILIRFKTWLSTSNTELSLVRKYLSSSGFPNVFEIRNYINTNIKQIKIWFGDIVVEDTMIDTQIPEIIKSRDLSSLITGMSVPVRNITECQTFITMFSQECTRLSDQQQTMFLDLNTLINNQQIINRIQSSTGSSEVVDEFREYLTNLQNTTTDLQKNTLLLLSGSPEQTIEVLKESEVQYYELKVNLECLKRQSENIKRNQTQIETLEKQNESIYQKIIELQQILGYLNPKQGISKQYIRYMFSFILADVQRYLESMNSTFIVDIDNEVQDELTFKFKPLDRAIWLPMKKLSGGQKITLSIAFLLAIQNIVCPGLCFLVLDEPSTHLDVQSREALCHLIEGIGLELNNGQIWVIDHDTILERTYKTKIAV